MKVSSSTGVSAPGSGSTVDQSLDDLEQMLEQIRQAQQGGAQVNPTQLANGISNALNNLKGPQEQGQLSPDQDSRLQNALQTIGNMMQGNSTGQQPPGASATGYPTDDKYDPSKVEGGKVHGHHGGGHVHAAPPVDDPDADSNTLPTNNIDGD